jgi:START domain
MITLTEWYAQQEKWLDQDLALMSSDSGWKKRTQKHGINIWQRSFPDDKNDLFRWRIPVVAADFREVFDVFVNQMPEYHQYWTAEYSGGFRVKEVAENAQIIYQQFDPNIPLISKRDLLYIQWSRQIDERRIQTSFRSIVLDDTPVPKGFERIDWWGGHLFEANPDGSSQLVLIDRENQGGRFPSWMMNQTMPTYLSHQFQSIIAFFEKGGTAAHEKLPDAQNTALGLRQAWLS